MDKIYIKPYRCYQFEVVNFLKNITKEDKVICNSLNDIEHLRAYAGKYFKGKFKSKQLKSCFVMELK